MKWYIFILIIPFLSCSNNTIRYTVHGTLPDSSFNNEYVYLFPFNNMDISMLDSVLIIEDSFDYNGFADSVYMMVVRAKENISRFELEDMLFIIQPGNVHIHLNESSTVGGTPLNDSIQKWKIGKEMYRLKLMEATADSESNSTHKKDPIRDEIIKFHSQMALNNKDNPLGHFIVSMMQDLFTEEQLNELSY